MQQTVVLTGAFSYTGRYVARRLIDRGFAVRTLTHHPGRPNPFGERLQVLPYNFEDPPALAASFRGASVLINTYWVRFPHLGATFERAVANTRTLFEAALQAGIKRIVHVSIANPSLDSPLGYYKGKARLEEALKESGLSYAILRPTVIFGTEDILINNIAWFVRRFPVFGIPGDGDYRVQPIYVEDMAELLVEAATHSDSYTLDAVGPEIYTFGDLVRLIATKVGRRPRLVHVPPWLANLATKATGWVVGDIILTWEEYLGLMGDLLVVDSTPPGTTRLSEWLATNASTVGIRYHSEIARHFR